MRSALAGLLGAALLLTGCGGALDADRASRAPSPDPTAAQTPTPTTARPSSAPTTTPATTPAPGTVPPRWLGRRVLPRTADGFGEVRPTPRELRNRRFTLPDRLPMLRGAGFRSRVQTPPPPEVLSRSTWVPRCPVGVQQLSWIRVTFWGFDDRRHTGELLANAGVARDLVQVFGELYAARFPMEELRITRRDEQTAPPTGDGNNTGAFNCRPVRGSNSYSQHAYGLAVDVNPFQNPYAKGELVLPELAGAYVDRGRRAPGMIRADGVVVRAFARIGWEWGGAWRSLKDYQHFSENGR